MMTPSERAELARLICSFNARPEIHPSWLASALPGRHRFREGFFLERPGAVAAQLGASLLGLRGSFDFDFRMRSKRIALLSSRDLDRLTVLCGLSLHGHDLRDRPAASLAGAIAKRIGSADYDFVIHRLAGIVEPTSPPIAWDSRATPALSQIRRTGCGALLALLGTASAAVTGRARLKLPKQMSLSCVPSLSAVQVSRLEELLLLCIIPERLPEWDWLF